MKPKYFVTEPVEGGYAYWDVRDGGEAAEYPNFSVASFFRAMPNAERECRDLCARLNSQ